MKHNIKIIMISVLIHYSNWCTHWSGLQISQES